MNAPWAVTAVPDIDLASTLQFVINATAGSSEAQAKRDVIAAALRSGGRRGDLLFCTPAELAGVAHQAAAKALAHRTAVVAVGGDGTLNTVAQAAHAVGSEVRHIQRVFARPTTATFSGIKDLERLAVAIL